MQGRDALASCQPFPMRPTHAQDPESSFLGEESALVFPPAGRTFGGAPSAGARAGMGVGAGGHLPPHLAIDPMDDLRYPRGAAARSKHIQIESLGKG